MQPVKTSKFDRDHARRTIARKATDYANEIQATAPALALAIREEMDKIYKRWAWEL